MYKLFFISIFLVLLSAKAYCSDTELLEDFNAFKKEISTHNYETFKNGGLDKDGKSKPTIAFILPITEEKLAVAKEMYAGFFCLEDYNAENSVAENSKNLSNCLKQLENSRDNKPETSLKTKLKKLPFNVLIKNDEDNTNESISLARELIAKPNIIAVVGHNSGINTIIASKTYNKRHIPIISPTADGTMVSNEDSNVMQMLPTTDDTTEHFVKYIHNYFAVRGIEQPRILLCHEKAFDSASAILSFYSLVSYKIKLVDKINLIDDGTCDLDKKIEDTKPIILDSLEKIDGVIIIAGSDNIEKSFKLLNFKLLNNPYYKKPYEKKIQIPIFLHPSFLTKSTLENSQYIDENLDKLELHSISPFFNKNDTQIPWRTAMVYDTFLALEVAYESVKSEKIEDRTNITPLDLKDKLKSSDFVFNKGLTGNVFFSHKRTHEDTYQRHDFNETHNYLTGDLNPVVKITRNNDEKKVEIKPYQ